jgi:predicted transcriptional regulator
MMMTSATTTPMSIKLDARTRERLAELAGAKKRTAHAIAREAIEDYVAREEAKERFNQDALQAWQNFQETGVYIAGDDVLAWVESWGSDQELAPPKCHV